MTNQDREAMQRDFHLVILLNQLDEPMKRLTNLKCSIPKQRSIFHHKLKIDKDREGGHIKKLLAKVGN